VALTLRMAREQLADFDGPVLILAGDSRARFEL